MKIFCVGRNYADHAKELGNAVPEEPVIFMKPKSALLQSHTPFYYPEFTKDLHHEIEIVLKINKVGKHIDEQFAHKYYEEIGLGIDFTARDLQTKAKEKGLPWEKAKAFDGSAPLGKFVPKAQLGDVSEIGFALKVNGEIRQRGNTSDLLFTADIRTNSDRCSASRFNLRHDFFSAFRITYVIDNYLGPLTAKG